MADGTITTGDEIAHSIMMARDGTSVYGPAQSVGEVDGLPMAPLAMPTQDIETDGGPVRRLWRRLRMSGRAASSVDVSA